VTKGQDVSTSIVSRAPQGISEPALSAQPTPIELFWGLQRAVLVASASAARPPMIKPWRANQGLQRGWSGPL